MEVLSNRDNIVIASFDSSEKDTFSYFYAATTQDQIKVELAVTDVDTGLLVNTYNYDFTEFNIPEFVKIIPLSSGEQGGYLELYTVNILEALGYIRGTYTVSYKFYFDILGNSSDEKLFIRRISSSRKELILDYVNKETLNDYKIFSDKYFNKFSQNFIFNKFLNFGNDDNLLVLNAKNQIEEGQPSLIVKLYETLPPKFSAKDVFWFVEFITDAIEDTVPINVSLIPDIFDTANILRPPNISIFDSIGRNYTTYKDYYDLVDTSSLGDKYFAEWTTEDYIGGIDLNIKYNNFDNFVHFGSALEMVNNFRNKLLTIEQHDTKITSSVSISNSHLSSSLYHNTKKSEIIGGFTKYEKFLYYDSGSYFTSSLFSDYTTSSIDATYPKLGSDIGTYSPYAVSSSDGVQWYTTMSAVAFDYDNTNDTALVNTLPGYIKQDLVDNLTNENYILFTNMVGEFYDNIWAYIVSAQRTLKRENKFEDGVPEELVWNVLRNHDLDLNGGESLVDLSRYKYGYYISQSSDTAIEIGTTDGGASTEQFVTHEIWNRILNNYPYIFKSKGTEKSIRALFNCYGLPNSLIQIQEFGGPYTTGSVVAGSNKKYTFDYTDFTFLLEMTGSEYIEVPWTISSYDSMKPDSIEFKFRTPYNAGNIDLFSLSGSDGWVKLELEKTYDEYGRLKLSINDNSTTVFVTSSVKAFANNEFYSVMVKRSVSSDATATLQNYSLNIKNHDDYINQVTIDESHTLSITSAEYSMNDAYVNADALYLGGYTNSTQKFFGAMDEFRLWAEPLTDRTFDFHAKYSAATNGNRLTSSLETLAFRLSFNDAYDLGATSSMPNDAFTTASYAPYATASNFVTHLAYPFSFSDYERSNTVEQSFIAADMTNEKIRIEENSIVEYVDSGSIRYYPLKGNYTINDYKPQGEVGEFDNAAPDLDTLLIGFTPIDIINKDIIAFFGNNDILGAYGDYNNLYEDYYPKNNSLITSYWNNTKNPISFNSYLDYISTYNNSLFDTIIEFVPAKATTILGTVYEQNMLRRNRVKLINPEVAVNYREHLFPVDGKPHFEALIANDSYEEGTIDLKEVFTVSNEEVENLEGTITDMIKFPVEGHDSYVFNSIVYRLNKYRLVTYNEGAVNRQRDNTDRFRTFDGNTTNSSLTSYDRGPAVVLTVSNPKKLIVNYADNPKLLVKS